MLWKKAEITATIRFVAVLAPQSVLSAVAVALFVRESGYSDLHWMRLVIWTHLAGVIAIQALFLFRLGRRPPSRLLACAAFCAATALNLSYAAQALALHVWSSPLTPAIRRTLWPQVRYFAATVDTGRTLAIACAALLLLLAGGLAFAWRQSRRFWSVVRWAAPPRGLCLALAVLPLLFLFFGSDAVKAVRDDPVLSPWIGFDVRPEATPGELSADIAARRNYPVVSDFRRRTVIVIIIDCLRADHLPMFGYSRNTSPFLGELSAAGRLQPVDEAYSVSNASKNGILGVLASRYPEGLRIGNFMLQDVLKLEGYRTSIIASGDHTVFQSLRAYYGDHVDFFVDGLSAGRFTVNDDRNVLATIERLPASDGTPAFFYLHLMSAHPVGVRQPESLRWPSNEGARWTTDFGAGLLFRQAAIDTYDDGILQADLNLRRIFADLQAKGYLRDYVAVITGDHGESFGEHGASGHGRSLWQSEVRVPILFMESGDFRYGRMPFASQVDIAPTLLDRLNLPEPSSWQGRSLLSPSPDTRAFLTETAPGEWRGFVEERAGHRYKYLFDARGPGNFQEKLFDLASDPAEARDLAGAAAPDLLAGFRRVAAEHFQMHLPP